MALEYAVHIQRLPASDGGGYLATVPELPGCMSDGETAEAALKNVQEAIESWVQVAEEWKLDAPDAELTARAVEALNQLPLTFQQKAVAFLVEQSGKYRALKQMIEDGEADIAAGRVREWDFDDFLRRARLSDPRDD